MFLCTKRDREKLVLKIYERCIINKVGTFYIVAFFPHFLHTEKNSNKRSWRKYALPQGENWFQIPVYPFINYESLSKIHNAL